MHSLHLALIFLLIVSVQCGKQKSNNKKNILIIDDVKQFKKIIKTHTNLLVLFSDTEKAASAKLDLLTPLAEQFKGKGSVAFVNCGEYSKVCKKFKISTKSGPLLKHYKNGKFNKDYDRKETLRSLTTFMNDPTGDTPWEEEDGADAVRHIDGDQDLNKFLRKEKKPIFVMFYAPWCGFCKRLKPVYQEMAEELKQTIVLAGMDVDKQDSMNARMQFNITGFPTLIYFKGGEERFRYKGKHDKDLLIDWLKNPTSEAPKAEEDEEEEWKDTPSDVVHLTDQTFDEYISSNPSVLVMFYAPWCGHCKAMKPEYVDAAQTMKEENIVGTLAAVDATKETVIGKKFELKGFPTVKYFRDGEFAFDMNERKADKFVEFMKDPKEPPPPEPEWKDIQSEVSHLGDSNFKEFLKKKKHVLVMFYAPWCGHCKQAKPEFTDAAKHYTDNKKVEFAAVDCTTETSTCAAHGVEGYPTIIYFNYGKNDIKYTGGRVKDDFISYMTNPQEPRKAPPEEPQWSDEPSFVEHLRDDNFEEFIHSQNSVLVMFYAPWCGHCKAMKPAYMEAAEEIDTKKISGVLAAVNCMKEQGLRTKYEITGFPAVKYFKNGKYAFDYPRSRTKDDLVDFMVNPVESSPTVDSSMADIAWSDAENDVVHLSDANFEQFVQDHTSTLVMFYAPWCGHCKKAKPEYEEAASVINKATESSGKIAAVDCTQNNELCAKFGVKGYPTIKYFSRHGKDSMKYTNPRNAQSFIEFMKKPQLPEPEWSTVPGKIIHLTDDSLVDFLKTHKSVLVMFYSLHCSYCKAMKPDYIAAAEQLSEEGSDIVLAAMDARKNLKTAEEHVKTGYPTIKFFRYGEEITEYDGSRSKDDIIDFVKSWDKDSAGEEKEINQEFDFVSVRQLSQDTFQTTLRDHEHALVMFYAPWCGHCQSTKPEFEETAATLKEQTNKILAAVDCTVHTDLCGQEKIEGYPTIKYYHHGSYVSNYEKSRTTEDFLLYLHELPSHSAQRGKEEL